MVVVGVSVGVLVVSEVFSNCWSLVLFVCVMVLIVCFWLMSVCRSVRCLMFLFEYNCWLDCDLVGEIML